MVIGRAEKKEILAVGGCRRVKKTWQEWIHETIRVG